MLAGWAASVGRCRRRSANRSPAPSPAARLAGTVTGASTPRRRHPAPAPKTTIDNDGTYAVGTDIAPGIYSSAGPVGNGTCYWKRTGNPDGNLIDNALSKKPQVVQIDPTDKSFKTIGCQPWQLTPDATPPAKYAASQACRALSASSTGCSAARTASNPPHS